MQRTIITIFIGISLLIGSQAYSENYAPNYPAYKAAKEGDVEAQYRLAQELDTDHNFAEAVLWYQKAAEQNHMAAQRTLGYQALLGRLAENSEIPSAEDQAYFWFKKAADQGDAIAQFAIGELYREDRLDITAKLKNPDDYNEYWDYIGEQKQYWYTKAAEQGYDRAQYHLGIMYRNNRDFVNAKLWLEKAADQGLTEAETLVGMMYFDGEGTVLYENEAGGFPQDYKKAYNYLEKAANNYSPSAQFFLGEMYYHGLGVDQDHNKAKQWYQQACDLGLLSACDTLNDIK